MISIHVNIAARNTTELLEKLRDLGATHWKHGEENDRYYIGKDALDVDAPETEKVYLDLITDNVCSNDQMMADKAAGLINDLIDEIEASRVYLDPREMLPNMTEWALHDWLAECEARFGQDMAKYKFVCPKCGRVNAGYEYQNVGAEPDDMAQGCIGRFDQRKGCNWAAYGLFGTMGRGDIVKTPDGKQIAVFRMAPSAQWKTGARLDWKKVVHV